MWIVTTPFRSSGLCVILNLVVSGQSGQEFWQPPGIPTEIWSKWVSACHELQALVLKQCFPLAFVDFLVCEVIKGSTDILVIQRELCETAGLFKPTICFHDVMNYKRGLGVNAKYWRYFCSFCTYLLPSVSPAESTLPTNLLCCSDRAEGPMLYCWLCQSPCQPRSEPWWSLKSYLTCLVRGKSQDCMCRVECVVSFWSCLCWNI